MQNLSCYYGLNKSFLDGHSNITIQSTIKDLRFQNCSFIFIESIAFVYPFAPGFTKVSPTYNKKKRFLGKIHYLCTPKATKQIQQWHFTKQAIQHLQGGIIVKSLAKMRCLMKKVTILMQSFRDYRTLYIETLYFQ